MPAPTWTLRAHSAFKNRIRTLKDHPALFGWQLFDEPENAANLARLYGRAVKVSPATFKTIY